MLIGQILDEKYRVERELGRGGMGSVYLATHVGTERAVAVKVIAPEFMRRGEFIERFRREARAAGRLRHPNVVNVTDFGIAETAQGSLAYLVMEYLDGCTLGEILEEEKKLPLSWTLDILEQTCAAVTDAHHQGIIHRDLKPDNIWLEPNAQGGYTIKVLDFGIAKLEEPAHRDDELEKAADSLKSAAAHSFVFSNASLIQSENQTLAMSSNLTNKEAGENATLDLTTQIPNDFTESQTIALNSLPKEVIANENATAIFPAARATAIENNAATADDNSKTKILTQDLSPLKTTTEKDFENDTTTAALTRVGAVLGTPLYMSPEQCSGERLGSRADIYSLGVIAYQMLSGAPPFTGKYTDVMQAHKETAPPPLEAKNVPRKVKKVINSALSKDPERRPETALAFASKLRSSSEGIGVLLRRALTIYSEHLPVFIGLAFLLHLPILLSTIVTLTNHFLMAGGYISDFFSDIIGVIFGIFSFLAGIFFGSILIGVTTWIVAQILAVPLRPVGWRAATTAARKKWRSFAGTVTLTTLIPFVAFIVGLIISSIITGLTLKYGKNYGVNWGAPNLIMIALVCGLIALWIGALIPGFYLFTRFHLVTSVVMMENLRGFAALKRSSALVMRSLWTVVAAVFLSFFLPFITVLLVSIFAWALIKSSDHIQIKTDTGFAIVINDDRKTEQTPKEKEETAAQVKEEPPNANLPATSAAGEAKAVNKDDSNPEKRMMKAFQSAVQETLFHVLWFPVLVLISSFTAVVTALLYLKTRQAGGESFSELVEQFEETERAQKRWQLRLKAKLEQSGRHTSRNT